jgi:hypothetical protein
MISVLPERLISCYRSACPTAVRGRIDQGGEPTGSISAMVFPLQNPFVPVEPDAGHLRPSPTTNRGREHATAGYGLAEPASDGDLQRLEASVSWLKREALIVRDKAGLRARELHAQERRVALPRAGRLPPISGIPPVDAESSFHRREWATFRVAPPLPSERLQLPLPRSRHRLRGALLVLIASAIVGSITYRVLVGGWFPASVPAQAAPLQAE